MKTVEANESKLQREEKSQEALKSLDQSQLEELSENENRDPNEEKLHNKNPEDDTVDFETTVKSNKDSELSSQLDSMEKSEVAASLSCESPNKKGASKRKIRPPRQSVNTVSGKRAYKKSSKDDKRRKSSRGG